MMTMTLHRKSLWQRLFLASLIVVGLAVAAVGQEETVEPTPEGEMVAGATDPGMDPEGLPDLDEPMLSGSGYIYDPGDRRDPFKSLLDARQRPELRGPRPEGIPGLLIDEVDLTGIFITADGPVAQVQSADRGISYLLRAGDQLYDGDVVAITEIEILFKQIVDDPTALKPFREVAKELNP